MAATFLGNRISFTPSTQTRRQAALEVAMLGHCPGRVRPDRLTAQARKAIEAVGFGTRQASSAHLHHVPVPLASFAEFDDIFPDALDASAQHHSLLAGKRAWLPQAVEDFFANGGERLWVIAIPEEEGFYGFLPRVDNPLYDVENLRGLATALVLPKIGLLTLPDLERLQIAANLSDIPRKRLANPDPQFLPCGTNIEDDHRERRISEEIFSPTEPAEFSTLLQRLLGTLNKHRPDVQCLLSMPLDYSEQVQSPSIDETALEFLDNLRTSSQAYLLRQVQLLYPYLRKRNEKLHTSVGALSGLIAQSAAQQGHWRSVAHIGLVSDAAVFPAVSTQQRIQLRESPGIGVLMNKHNRLMLDDERLCVTALHRLDNPVKGTRSGEVVRFMGFLVRQLQNLGEQLIFNLDPRDPRPRLVLEKFFVQLFNLGALRGSLPEQAFTIRQTAEAEGQIAFDIEVAPAYPIDKIIISLINRQGQWQAQVDTLQGQRQGGEHA